MKENSWTDEKKATKDYYDVNDIKEITGKSKSLAYKIIRILQDKFKKDFPDTITTKKQKKIEYNIKKSNQWVLDRKELKNGTKKDV